MDLISKPRTKSSAWLYFGLKADEKGQPLNSEEAICRLCRKIVLTKGGNTTNLRSHLKRHHPADFQDALSSVSSAVLPLVDAQGLDLNGDELLEDFLSLQTASKHSYVPDAVLPPGESWLRGGPSRALLSLPSCLQVEEMKVYAKCHLLPGVVFGPFVGEISRQVPSNLKYVWAIRDDSAFIYVNASDENKSNWMRYVTYTSGEEDHNLVIFQFYRRIYYKVSQPITEGAELKVQISRDYAALLGLSMGDSEKCQVGDKETVLRLLQDIKLVELPEDNSSSPWADLGQSQSPRPAISDVTSVSSRDAASDTGFIPADALPSSSFSFSSPNSGLSEKYDFMPGTEKLLSCPVTHQNSPWNFFGFEPDPSGQPLDQNSAVCKMCGEHVSCGGGTADLQNHLISKHHFRPRDGHRERRTGLMLRDQCSPSLMTNSSLISTVPQILASHVTNAIADFVIMDLQPPALVEGEGFRQLFHTLLPSYKELPSACLLEDLLRDRHAKGKWSLARMMKRTTEIGEESFDHTAPLEFETFGQHSTHHSEPPYFVTFSVDIWFHNWQEHTELYLTLWAHYIDLKFSFHNVALETQRLKEPSLPGVEAQVKAIGQEWHIFQPNALLLGGEGKNKMTPGPSRTTTMAETAGSVPHPNSTTFLEREGSPSQEGPPESQNGRVPSSVPCFFSVVKGCIEEMMSHPVISKTLGHFQSILSALFLSLSESKLSYQHRLLETVTAQEEAELKTWAHSQPSWNRLFSLLSMLLKLKSLFCNVGKGLQTQASPVDEASSESSPAGGCSTTTTPTWKTECKLLEELCLVLRPLDVACRTLAKEAFPRLSLIKPILTGLLSRHLVLRPGDTSVLKEVKKMMRQTLTSCYDSPEVNKVICVACSLDPQFHRLGFMGEKEQKATFDWLKKETIRIVKEDRKRTQRKNRFKRSPSTDSSGSESDLVRRSKRLKNSQQISFKEAESGGEESDAAEDEDSDFSGSQSDASGMEFLLGDLFSVPRSSQSSVEEAVDMELSVFRADKGMSLGVEPLQWWRTKAVQFPLLATAARAYLAAPAVAGNAVQEFLQEGAGAAYKKRGNIPPESLDSILFLHHNHMPTTDNGQTRRTERVL